MLSDYSIDPHSIGDCRDLRKLYDSIGFNHGRLIIENPTSREWIKSARNTASTDPNYAKKAKEYEIILSHISKSGFSELNPDIDTSKEWLDNSRKLLSESQIRAIITNETTADTLSIDELSNLFNAWKVMRSIQVERTVAHFSLPISKVTRRARKLKLIDPYFDLCLPRFLKFFHLCYKNCSDNCSIEIHCDASDCKSYLTPNYESIWKTAAISSGKRQNVKISIILWQELPKSYKIHDRYLLTNMGGIRIPTGLDLIGAHDKADVSIIDTEVYNDIYSRYDSNGNNPKFKFIKKLSL